MAFETPNGPETSEKEISKERDDQDNFMVPEGWIKDITEAQKEAYRIKAFALASGRPAEPNSGLFESNYKGPFPPGKTDADLTAIDYENAKELYKEIFEDQFKRSGDKGLDRIVGKIANATAGNIIRAYIELRARMLAKQERKAIEDDIK